MRLGVLITYGLQLLVQVESDIKELLELLEADLSPRNWTIMFHLLEHFPKQIREWGPIPETWMFRMESYFGNLTRLIKNRAYPVANVLRCYAISKATNLCLALMSHQANLTLNGQVPRILLPPCIRQGGRTAQLGGRTRWWGGDSLFWEEFTVFLKNTDEWRGVHEAWRVAKQGGSRSARWVCMPESCSRCK